jgi:hypothetical protein
LKKNLRKLYQKYCKDANVNDTSDQDTLQEFERQRGYLERTVNALERTSLKDKLANKKDGIRLMQDNALLLSELHMLKTMTGAVVEKEKSLNIPADADERSTVSLPQI